MFFSICMNEDLVYFTQFILFLEKKILEMAIIKHLSDGFNKGIPINSIHPVPDYSEKENTGDIQTEV